MACATLKRSLEFDPLHSPSQRPVKRRKFVPVAAANRTPPTKIHETNPSPFGEVSPKFTAELIAAKLQDEVRRMQKRRQLHFQQQPCSSGSSSPSHSDCDMPASPCSSATATGSSSSGSLSSKRDQPMFTMKQVSIICERMVKERETQVREEYDKMLTCKLAEQYDSFVKFSYDQLQRRFQNAPVSYVS